MAEIQEENGVQDGEEVVVEASGDVDADSDEADIADLEESAEDALRKCKERLKACQKERLEFLDGWQRAKADFLNHKQRLEQERGEERERSRASFAASLLPLCDSFERARAEFANGDVSRSEANGKNWRAGIAQIYNQLAAVLKSYGVEAIDPAGAPFDPRLHEALSEREVADPAQDHAVLEVAQKGYRIGTALIRPAQVVVGKYKND